MAQKKYVSLSKLQTFLDNLKSIFAAKTHTHTMSDLTDYTVDSALSDSSINPVQNKVIDAEFDAIATAMNALDSAIDGKADSTHAHTISEVSELQVALDELQESIDAIPQSDWNQNDETAADYIKNRTHYEEIETVTETRSFTLNNSSGWIDVTDTEFVNMLYNNWESAQYKGANSVTEESTTNVNDLLQIKVSFDYVDVWIIFKTDGTASIGENTGSWGGLTITVNSNNTVVHKLDQKYIPDTIARAEDIPEVATPDWSQNDENGEGYIKNRTHYEEVNNIVALQETTIENANSSTVSVSYENNLLKDTEYVVTFDGIEYTCTSWSFATSVCLGSGALLYLSGYGGDEPFLIINNLESNSMGIKTSDSGSHTMSIEGNIVVYHKIDEKFLPDLVGKSNQVLSSEVFNDYKNNIASGQYSHAEGYNTTASGAHSHAEGSNTIASGAYSHAEGDITTASGAYSHAEGYRTVASGNISHAEGITTTAASAYQHAQGKWNIVDANDTYAHIVGNGVSEALSNAHTLDWDGVGWYQGGLQVGGNAQDDGAKNVLLEGDAIPTPTTATVGQTIVVKSVDENGKPTEWEAVDSQSDWNENDKSASGYVKNRPFWTDDPVETVLIEETTNEWTAAGFDGAFALAPIDIVDGETYIVMFDGVEYECTAYISSGPNSPSIGDGSIADAGNDGSNGEPFFITTFNDVTLIIVGETGEHTVSVSGMVAEIHKIDVKYLPPVIICTIDDNGDDEWMADVGLDELYSAWINGGTIRFKIISKTYPFEIVNPTTYINNGGHQFYCYWGGYSLCYSNEKINLKYETNFVRPSEF